MMRVLFIAGLLWSVTVARAEESGLLLYWNFDEGQGTVAGDSTANNLQGTMRAGWGESPSGAAAVLDGTPETVVSVDLPAPSRLGKASWTVMAWVKPTQFEINDRQNQRRLFSYGEYPRAYFCLDVLGSGEPTLYQVHLSDQKSVDHGVTSAKALVLERWAHIAVVCERDERVSAIYINGQRQAEQAIPAEFDADFNVNGSFTVGSPWHNFDGIVDEVRLYRRALSTREIRAEFHRLRAEFQVTLTAAEQAEDKRAAARESLAAASEAYVERDFATVQQALLGIIDEAELPPHYRSYAHLRLAQSYAANGQPLEAMVQYKAIADQPQYPSVHRQEAAELIAEMERTARGLPARDPAASRVAYIPGPVPRVSIHVAPDGDDSHPGTAQQPLATLHKARDKAREAMARMRGGVEIVLAPGEYPMAQTLVLGDQDSGTPDAPVVWRSRVPGTAILYGGRRLSGFAAVTDQAILERLPEGARAKVVQVNLRELGITDIPALAVRGIGQPPSPPTLELYVDRRPMRLARWPNEGFVKPAKLVEPGDRENDVPSVLAYEGDRPARWTSATDGWLFGYFRYLWADSTVKIGHIDPVARTITTDKAYHYIGPMSEEQGIIYYAFNLLEELDAPGEWYLDRQTDILYLYPPADLSKATVELSMLNDPLIAGTGLNNVRFEGLILDMGRTDGLVLRESSDCLIAGCTIRRMAGNAVIIRGGERNVLLSCDIHTIGRRGAEVIGGERQTLKPGGHVVANCWFHDFGRIDRTYTPGVQLEGVGNRVTHNRFSNSPSSVIRIEGNDHVIEYNEVSDALLESDDQGAMELYGNPSYRGVIFRHNLFRRIGSPAGRSLVHGQAAIRLDDAISGVVIYGNVFEQAANGQFGGLNINSGRDNIIDNNLFVNCSRGIGGGYFGGNAVWQALRSGRRRDDIITSPLYIQRYPEIARMLEEPAVNHAWRNIFYQCGQDIAGNRAALDLLANEVCQTEPGFVNAAQGNWRLNDDAAVLQRMWFRAIPIEEIGLYTDPWRTALPPTTAPSDF